MHIQVPGWQADYTSLTRFISAIYPSAGELHRVMPSAIVIELGSSGDTLERVAVCPLGQITVEDAPRALAAKLTNALKVVPRNLSVRHVRLTAMEPSTDEQGFATTIPMEAIGPRDVTFTRMDMSMLGGIQTPVHLLGQAIREDDFGGDDDES